MNISMNKLKRQYCCISHFAEHYGSPVVFLAIRVWLGKIFFISGIRKIDNWETTLSLFKDDYKVPLIPYEITAYLATTFELICPVLIIVGLATKLAAIPLFIMSVIIQAFVYDFPQHYFWMLCAALLITNGPGPLSIDYFLGKKNC